MRVDGIAHRAVRQSSGGLHETYRGFHIVDIVQCIEDAHDIDARGYGVLAKAFDDGIGIGGIPEEVSASGECSQL